MSYHQSHRVSDRKEEKPPHSRVFVVCGKQLREEDLRSRFEQFGSIEDLYIPRDRASGDSKGVAYIKYEKTSSAAAAIKELHMKVLGNDSKPTKVMIAVGRNESTENENEDRYRRLFIKVPKDVTETELRKHFSQFGDVESVHLQRDKLTDACKGFAYIQYQTFYDAAKAYEDCDRIHKPIFATPRENLKRSRNSIDMDGHYNSITPPNAVNNYNDRYNRPQIEFNRHDTSNSLIADSEELTTVIVKCAPQVPQKCIEQLFNIVPGMMQCEYMLDLYNGISKASVIYNDRKHADYAVEKLNNFEFPSGELMSVKLDKHPLSSAANQLKNIANSFKHAVDSGKPNLKQLADAIVEASTLIKAASGHMFSEVQDTNYCSVTLPSPKPLANNNSRVAQRLFIICKPQPPTLSVLHDVFGRFGDLIHVSTIPNKTFGFVKYASVSAAQEAMRTLNGATVVGIKIKVLEADEKVSKDDESKEYNNEHDYDNDNKRMRLNDRD